MEDKKKKRHSKLEGSVIEAMKQMNALDESIRHYFRSDSRFVRALEKHIQGNKDLVFKWPCDDCRPRYSSGQGPLCVRKTYTYGPNFENCTKQEFALFGVYTKKIESTVFCMDIEVLYQSHFRSEEEGTSNEYAARYSLRVPLELEDDSLTDEEFQQKFDAWTKAEHAKIAQEKKEKAAITLKGILAQYPDLLPMS